jgi:NADH-quinone oxidoreductase subunit H
MDIIAGLILLAIKIVILLTVVLLIVAYMTFMERRVLGLIQIRIGPNRVGPAGLFQPLADAVKLMGKEMLRPSGADPLLFRIAPILVMVPAFLVYALIPLSENLKITEHTNVGILLIMAISSLGIYGVIVGGWASNSKYSTLGALRSAAQMISYEVSLVLAMVCVIIVAGSMDLSEIVAAQKGMWFVFHPPLTIAFLIFFVAGVAETNRCPFDLPEAESELVGGYHTEFSGMSFGLFFMGEYANILTVCLLTTLLFLGGWNGPFLPGVVWVFIKTMILVFVFIWTRGTLPRLRYDQLMGFGWKFLLPLTTLIVLVTGAWKVVA